MFGEIRFKTWPLLHNINSFYLIFFHQLFFSSIKVSFSVNWRSTVATVSAKSLRSQRYRKKTSKRKSKNFVIKYSQDFLNNNIEDESWKRINSNHNCNESTKKELPNVLSKDSNAQFGARWACNGLPEWNYGHNSQDHRPFAPMWSSSTILSGSLNINHFVSPPVICYSPRLDL